MRPFHPPRPNPNQHHRTRPGGDPGLPHLPVTPMHPAFPPPVPNLAAAANPMAAAAAASPFLALQLLGQAQQLQNLGFFAAAALQQQQQVPFFPGGFPANPNQFAPFAGGPPPAGFNGGRAFRPGGAGIFGPRPPSPMMSPAGNGSNNNVVAGSGGASRPILNVGRKDHSSKAGNGGTPRTILDVGRKDRDSSAGGNGEVHHFENKVDDISNFAPESGDKITDQKSGFSAGRDGRGGRQFGAFRGRGRGRHPNQSRGRDVDSIVKQVADKLLEERAKKFEDQMNKMKEDIESLKQALSSKGESSGSGEVPLVPKDKKAKGDEEGNKKEKEFSNIPFDYSQMGKVLQLHSVNLGKPPSFDGINYNDWAHKMKLHLIAARAWEIVENGLSHIEGEEYTELDAVEFQQNAQVASLILSCLRPEESTKVHGMEVAKKIWDTLEISYEGDASVRKCNIELLQGKIENFTIKSGETTQQMFDRYMTLINKIRALGDEKWDDNSAARKLLRAYRKKNKTLASIIMERPNYETMGPHEMLAKIKHHEVLDDEAIEDQETSNKKVVAFKANQEETSKTQNDSSSEGSDDSDDEIALLVKNFRRFLRKSVHKRGKSGYFKKSKKRNCYECGADDHFIADCPQKKNKNKYNKHDDKKQGRRKGEAHVGEEWFSDDDSSDDEKSKKMEKGAANIAIHKASSSSLSSNVATSTTSSRLFEDLSDDEDDFTHSCFMAKDEKVSFTSNCSCDEYNDDD